MSDLHFGECEGCGNGVERPFWDRYCFNCQDEMREEDERRVDELAAEDHFLYAIPIRGGNSHSQEPSA